MFQQLWYAAVNTRNCHVRWTNIWGWGGEKPRRRNNGPRATMHYGAWSWANYLKDSRNGK